MKEQCDYSFFLPGALQLRCIKAIGHKDRHYAAKAVNCSIGGGSMGIAVWTDNKKIKAK